MRRVFQKVLSPLLLQPNHKTHLCPFHSAESLPKSEYKAHVSIHKTIIKPSCDEVNIFLQFIPSIYSSYSDSICFRTLWFIHGAFRGSSHFHTVCCDFVLKLTSKNNLTLDGICIDVARWWISFHLLPFKYDLLPTRFPIGPSIILNFSFQRHH